MRVLVATGQWFPDYAGGTARVVRATAEGLVKKGHEVVVIAPKSSEQTAASVVNGVEVRRVLRRSALPLSITDIYEVRRAVRAMQRDRFDVILAHGDICAAGVLAVRPRPPVALVFHASGLRESQYRRSLELTALERSRSLAIEPLLRGLGQYALRQVDRILVLSEFSRSLVLDADPGAEARIDIVGGGVDIDAFKPAPDRNALRRRLGIESERPVVMTARRLVGRMGVEMLLDAFRRLPGRDGRALLVIAGDGELRPALEARRDKLGLNGVVQFLGRISDSDLRDWYRAADVFVLPSLAYEGFGMVTAEALACGTPVVGTRVGATREILSPLDDDLLVPSLDARVLASTIERVLGCTGPALRARCRSYARDHLAWDVVLERWQAVLSDLRVAPFQADAT